MADPHEPNANIPRLPYIVNTFDKSTGAGEQLRIWAHTEHEAIGLIGSNRVSEGVFIEPATIVHLADDSLPPAHGPIVSEFRQVRIELATLLRSRILTHPIGTIAWGVVFGTFAFAILAAIFGCLVWFPRIPVH